MGVTQRTTSQGSTLSQSPFTNNAPDQHFSYFQQGILTPALPAALPGSIPTQSESHNPYQTYQQDQQAFQNPPAIHYTAGILSPQHQMQHIVTQTPHASTALSHAQRSTPSTPQAQTFSSHQGNTFRTTPCPTPSGTPNSDHSSCKRRRVDPPTPYPGYTGNVGFETYDTIAGATDAKKTNDRIATIAMHLYCKELWKMYQDKNQNVRPANICEHAWESVCADEASISKSNSKRGIYPVFRSAVLNTPSCNCPLQTPINLWLSKSATDRVKYMDSAHRVAKDKEITGGGKPKKCSNLFIGSVFHCIPPHLVMMRVFVISVYTRLHG
jgi:hypothetical protein